MHTVKESIAACPQSKDNNKHNKEDCLILGRENAKFYMKVDLLIFFIDRVNIPS